MTQLTGGNSRRATTWEKEIGFAYGYEVLDKLRDNTSVVCANIAIIIGHDVTANDQQFTLTVLK
jgi:hypothetical protein